MGKRKRQEHEPARLTIDEVAKLLRVLVLTLTFVIITVVAVLRNQL